MDEPEEASFARSWAMARPAVDRYVRASSESWARGGKHGLVFLQSAESDGAGKMLNP